MKDHKMNLIDRLPNELMITIFSSLSIGHLTIACIVSKKWKILIDFIIRLPKIKNDISLSELHTIHRETIDLTSLVEANDMVIIEKVINRLHKDTITRMIHKSAETGRLEILQLLHAKYHSDFELISNDLVQAAGINGHFQILKWLHENKIPINDIYYYAIKHGNIEMLDWAHQNKYLTSLMETHIESNNNILKILRWIQNHHLVIEPLPEYLEILDICQKYNYDVLTIDRSAYPTDIGKAVAVFTSCCIFAKFYEKASENHDMETLKWFKDEYHLVIPIGYVGAINGGGIDIFDWLYENGCQTIPPMALEYAVKMNRMDMVEWFENHGVTNEVTIIQAIEYGNLDFVKREVKKGVSIDYQMLEASIFHNEIFDYLVQMINDKSKTYQMMSQFNKFDILNIIIRKTCPKYVWDLGKSMFDNASRNGMFSYLKWLCKDSTGINTEDLLLNAIQIHHEPMVNWLLENGFYDKKDNRLYREAIEIGSLSLFQKLRKYDCQWNATVCADAAFYGEFAILKWAYENGCHWDEYTCINAASKGYLDILIWAKDNHCPWNEFVLIEAFENGHYYVFHWALHNGCVPSQIILARAAHNRNDQIIKLVQKYKPDACTFTKYHSKYTLEWLVKHSFAPDSILTERKEFCHFLCEHEHWEDITASDFSSFIDYDSDEIPTDEDILKRFHIKLE